MTNKFNNYINDVRPLSDWLNELREPLKSSQFKLPIKEKIGRYVDLIETDLFHREDSLNFSDQVIRNYNTGKLFNNDKIKLTYSGLRHQSIISLLVLNTRIYEKCVGLCYQLHSMTEINSFRKYYTHEILKFENKNTFNQYTAEKYKKILEILKEKFGHYMEIILSFRNQFVHRGERVETEGENIFLSDIDDELDYEFLRKLYNEIQKSYIAFQPDFSEKNFYKVMEKCVKYSDHHAGCLIYLVLKKILDKNGLGINLIR